MLYAILFEYLYNYPKGPVPDITEATQEKKIVCKVHTTLQTHMYS